MFDKEEICDLIHNNLKVFHSNLNVSGQAFS